MAFEAHPVTEERWSDLVVLFDRPIVRTCFCMFYRKTGSATGVGRENRQAMKALVGDDPVGGDPAETHPSPDRSVMAEASAGLPGKSWVNGLAGVAAADRRSLPP